MREEFHEDFASDKLDPLNGDVGHSPTDFDWNGMFERLGELENPLSERDYASMAQVLRLVFRWCLDHPTQPDSVALIGQRLLALVQVSSPGLLSGSQRDLALRFGVQRKVMQRQIGYARNDFGLPKPKTKRGHGQPKLPACGPLPS